MAGGWTIERLRTERQRARAPDRRRKEMVMQREKLGKKKKKTCAKKHRPISQSSTKAVTHLNGVNVT